MKHIFFSFFILLFFSIMLFFPSKILYAATNGLLLWFQILIPSLLPFFIITNLLIQSNTISYIVKFFGPIFQKLYRVSPHGSFAVLCGFLCGYPLGAKVTADLVKQKQISVKEGNYLLSFCNNTSPAFISSYIVLKQLKEPDLLIPSLFILYISPTICSFLFYRFHKAFRSSLPAATSKSLRLHFGMLDDSIMNAFETITKIGGYIILFSILFEILRETPLYLFLPLLEITNGITYLTTLPLRFVWLYVYTMGLTSFGGLCAIAQTYSVIQGSNLSLSAYIIEKLITALVTSFLAFIYVTIIPR